MAVNILISFVLLHVAVVIRAVWLFAETGKGRTTPGGATRYGTSFFILFAAISISAWLYFGSSLYAITCFILLFLATEAVLLYFFKRPGPPPVFYRFHPFKAYEAVPEATRRTGEKSNRAGFRGPDIERAKPKDVFRIFLVGGSTTYDGAHGDGRNYGDFISDELNEKFSNKRFELVNCALPGYTSMQSLILTASKLVDYAPDVIVFMHSINDASMRLLNIEQTDYSAPYGPYIVPEKKPWEDSLLFSMLLAEFNTLHNRWFRNGPEDLEQLVFNPEYYSLITGIESEWAKENLEKGSTYSYRRNLISMIGLSRMFGFDLVLCTAPINNHPACVWKWWHKYRIQAITENNEEALRVASEYSLPVVDLAKKFNGKLEYFVDLVHMNIAGQMAKSKPVAEAIGEIFIRRRNDIFQSQAR
ncbi:MAG: SGNH/GDSL hydrolase family protein [Nitrospinota bacterium]|nr:SGNH/GDSL hydrolase family protein [Nitrospinota bacterium]